MNIPELNRKVPPFLSWLRGAGFGKSADISTAFKEAITRTELELIRMLDIPYSESLMEDLYQAFDQTDLYHDVALLDFETFAHERLLFSRGKSKQRHPISGLSDDKTLRLADEYLGVALRILESFILPDFHSRLTSKYFGALAKIAQVNEPIVASIIPRFAENLLGPHSRLSSRGGWCSIS
jgi:hypothetical protein